MIILSILDHLINHKFNMVGKLTHLSYNIRKHKYFFLQIVEIVKTMYEYFNTPSKHFVESRNTFLSKYVLIWHFNSIAHTLIALAHTLIALVHTLIALAHTLIALAHNLIA